tara:strand:- start:13413 stop:13547 length:135 start_codon:yes stop_codon:yes gene_type:complete
MKVTKIYCNKCGYFTTGYYAGKGTPLMVNVPPNHIKDHKCKIKK